MHNTAKAHELPLPLHYKNYEFATVILKCNVVENDCSRNFDTFDKSLPALDLYGFIAKRPSPCLAGF